MEKEATREGQLGIPAQNASHSTLASLDTESCRTSVPHPRISGNSSGASFK